MSLVTRCTSCGTLFKVVADQLKISDGWVRCGQCATVFDAQSSIVSTANASESLAAPSAQTRTPSHASAMQHPSPGWPSSLHGAQPGAQQTQAAMPANSDAEPHDDIASAIATFRSSKFQGSGMLAEYAGEQAKVNASTIQPLPSEPSAFADAPLKYPEPSRHSGLSQLASDEPTTFFPASALEKSQWPESIGEQAQPSQLQNDVAIVAPSFVVEAQRAQRWRSPWLRFVLSVMCLCLLAILALQITLHNKDRLAAQWREAKPWLDQLCQPLDCKVQTFKRIESIAVDASSFNRVNKNNAQNEAITQSYRLAVTLKNMGTLPVSAPHVELSLQDVQDQTILRRVLSPADLGSSMSALAPSQEMPGSVTLQIDTTQLAGGRIQGYRVLAFYP